MGLLITMVIFAVIGAAMVTLLSSSTTSQVSASHSMKAQYMAEGGARYVIPLMPDSDFEKGPHVFKFNDGRTFFIINKENGSRFTSTGVVNEGSGWMESRVTIQYRISSLFDYCIFGSEIVTIDNNAVIDSYSSSDGPYDTTSNRNNEYYVGTNNSMDSGFVIAAGADFYLPDAGETKEQHLEAEVDKDMTPKELPAGWESWTDLLTFLHFTSNGQVETLTAGNYITTDMYFTNNSSLTIEGDVTIYVVGNYDGSQNSSLNIGNAANPDSSLTMYVGGDMDFSNNTVYNYQNNPADYIIYGLSTCNNIQLTNNSSTYGAIYAPTADVYTGNNAEMYGSIVADSITVRQNALIHYDEDLAGLAGGEAGVLTQYFVEAQ
ncbi:MAG: hypothetical protein JXO48_06205 [Deltaproteobacteria bacterium]|nr:hypothetical protein [Deltaproteobacteria bacterium]